MAQEQQPQHAQQLTPLVALYPAPPPFYKHFTRQNVTELRRRRKEAGVPASGPPHEQVNGDGKNDVDILSLPPDLRHLIPPPPPADGTYASFGESKSLSPADPTLADQNITQLYPDHPSVLQNPQPHLVALARSLLTKYLHILGVLSQHPEGYEESTKELETIVYNMHDLINRYRPHQARESLILMMEERVARLRGEIGGIEEGARKARELLRGFEEDAGKMGTSQEGEEQAPQGNSRVQDAEGRAKARQARAWAALAQEMEEG